MSQRYYELTEHPKLFSECYWGAFRVEEQNEDLMKIVSNRNRLVQDYKIVQFVDKNKVPAYVYNHTRVGGLKFDHTEFYKTEQGEWFIVNSPYGVSEADVIKLKSAGWTHIYQVYHQRAESLIKHV